MDGKSSCRIPWNLKVKSLCHIYTGTQNAPLCVVDVNDFVLILSEPCAKASHCVGLVP